MNFLKKWYIDFQYLRASKKKYNELAIIDDEIEIITLNSIFERWVNQLLDTDNIHLKMFVNDIRLFHHDLVDMSVYKDISFQHIDDLSFPENSLDISQFIQQNIDFSEYKQQPLEKLYLLYIEVDSKCNPICPNLALLYNKMNKSLFELHYQTNYGDENTIPLIALGYTLKHVYHYKTVMVYPFAKSKAINLNGDVEPLIYRKKPHEVLKLFSEAEINHFLNDMLLSQIPVLSKQQEFMLLPSWYSNKSVLEIKNHLPNLNLGNKKFILVDE